MPIQTQQMQKFIVKKEEESKKSLKVIIKKINRQISDILSITETVLTAYPI
jgi:hypothetical protein